MKGKREENNLLVNIEEARKRYDYSILSIKDINQDIKSNDQYENWIIYGFESVNLSNLLKFIENCIKLNFPSPEQIIQFSPKLIIKKKKNEI